LSANGQWVIRVIEVRKQSKPGAYSASIQTLCG
jgi:hypothetical protein